MEKKYRLLENDTKTVNGKTLYRIEALKDFTNVKKGDKGGYIESEDNLSHIGNCWVSDNAEIFGNACVFDNARVFGYACVFDNARVDGNAQVYGNTRVFGYAQVYGYAEVYGDAEVRSTRDYVVLKNIWSSGRYFTYTRSNKMWKVGCFYGTGEELIAKAYRDSEVSGREYKRVVEYVEAMYADLENDESK